MQKTLDAKEYRWYPHEKSRESYQPRRAVRRRPLRQTSGQRKGAAAESGVPQGDTQKRRAPCSATILGICIVATKTRSMLPKSVAAKRACLLRMMLSAAAIRATPTR